MRFDWTDLQLFVHACDTGSLTAAARRVHLTLAAVSARIRSMEDEAGVPLLQRHARGVRPTAAGEALAGHARAVLGRMDELRDALATHGSGGGRVRLLTNTSGLARCVAAPVGAFLRNNARCDIVLEESESHLTAQALRQGLADAGILSDAVDTQGLQARPLGSDPLVAVLPAQHALARQRSLDFAQVLAHPFVGCGPASALQAHLAMQAQRQGLAIRQRASAGQVGAVQDLVSQGVGVGVVPAALVRKQRGLVTRPLRDAWAGRTLLLCTPARAAARPAVRALLDCFAAA